MNINSFESIGASGAELMRDSVARAGAVAKSLASGSFGVADVAEASMELSQAKLQMAVGAFLIRTQEELMNSALRAFGVGENCCYKF
ncbi:MAG: hypothetical protein GX256_02725 [Fretibacterium sp.]|nr:hypothetical protein [Fretibacterium sp.]